MIINKEVKIPQRSIKPITRTSTQLGDSYEFISLNKTSITYKHLTCGTILTKPLNYFYTYPQCGKCVGLRRRDTLRKKYGVDNISQLDSIKREKIKTTIKNHGVSHPMQSKTIKGKSIDTCLNHYGVEHPMQSSEIKEKTSKTNVAKYGFSSPGMSPKIQEKIKNTCNNKYNVDFPMQSEEIKERSKQTYFLKSLPKIIKKLSEYGYEFLDEYCGQQIKYAHENVHKQYKIKHVLCGTTFEDDIFNIPRCPKCFARAGVSQQEEYWANYIELLLTS